MQALAVLSFFLASTLASPTLHARGDSCGVTGYDRGTIAYSYTKKAALATVQACGAKCASDSSCKSFAIGQGACLLYKKSVASNVDEDDDSPFDFYDKGCVSSNPAYPSSVRYSASVRASSVRHPSSVRQSSRAPTPSTPPTSGSCNLVGYDRQKPEAYFYSKKASNANYAACSALCQKNACKSFAYSNKECLLYSALIAGNFDAETSSPYRFFDATCIVAGASSSAIVTSSSSVESTPSPSSSLVETSSPSIAPSSSSETVTSSDIASPTQSSYSSAVSSPTFVVSSSSSTLPASSSVPSTPSTSSSALISVLSSSMLPSTSLVPSAPSSTSSVIVIASSTIVTRSSSTGSSAPSATPSRLCDFKVIDLTTPKVYVQSILPYYATTLVGCQTMCLLTSCDSILFYTGACFALFGPTASLNLVPTDIEDPGVPRFYERSCFEGSIPDPIIPSQAHPPTPANGSQVCGTEYVEVDINYGTFVTQGVDGDKLSVCSPLCLGLNCVSFAIDPNQGCVFFNSTVSRVGMSESQFSTVKLYDRACVDT